MARYRNPRPRTTQAPSTDNPRRPSPRALREMRAAFRDLVRLNPRAASATLDVLEIVANRTGSTRVRIVSRPYGRRPDSVRAAVARSREARLRAVERRVVGHLRLLRRNDRTGTGRSWGC